MDHIFGPINTFNEMKFMMDLQHESLKRGSSKFSEDDIVKLKKETWTESFVDIAKKLGTFLHGSSEDWHKIHDKKYK